MTSEYIATVKAGRVLLDLHPAYVEEIVTRGPAPDFWQMLSLLAQQARIQAAEAQP